MARKLVSGFSLNTHNGASEGTFVYGKKVSRATARGTLAWCRKRIDELHLEENYFGGLQETHDRNFVENLVARASIGRAHKATILRPPFDGVGAHNAILTNLPVVDWGYEEFVPTEPVALMCAFLKDLLNCSQDADLSENVCGPEDGKRLKFSRPVVWADLQFPDGPVTRVYVVHTKSKRRINFPGENEQLQKFRGIGMLRSLFLRSGDAIGLRWLLDDHFEKTGRPAIVLGDVNDDPHAVTTQIMLGEEPWRFAKFDEKRTIWSRQLYDVIDVQARRGDLDARAYYTYAYSGRHSRLDQILVSNHFNIRTPGHIGFVENARVFHDNVYDRMLEGEPPKYVSDHGTPRVTLAMGNYSK